MTGKYGQKKTSHANENNLYEKNIAYLRDNIRQRNQNRLMQEINRIGGTVKIIGQKHFLVPVFFSENKQYQNRNPADKIDP